MSELVLSDLHKRFGENVVLAGLDLVVPSGAFAALLGPSGAGKTTLLRLLAGFDAPDQGTITVGGRVVSGDGVQVAPEQRRIGYVPQEGSLFPHLSVAGNVGFALPRRARRARVGELLELVGLAGLEKRYPHQLSGGQQQRVALARALAVKPDLVLLDEPFVGLDASLRSELRDEVRHILAGAGATTLLVTHNQDEALSSADLVAVLRDARIVQQGPPQELYTSPVDDLLAGFIGAANLVDGVLEPLSGDRCFVQTKLGRLPARWHGELPACPCAVTALIRPEQIALTTADGVLANGDGGPRLDGDHQPVGRVVQRGFHGHCTILQVELGSDRDVRPLLVRTLGSPSLAPGDRCALCAKGAVLVWPQGAPASGVAATETPER